MKQDIINFWKKYYQNVLFFIISFIIIASIILPKNMNSLDEIWIYDFAKNMADGLVPYRDFNMVTTPLLPFICSLFLIVFGNQLFVMRILAIFLITFIFFISYLILKKLNVNKYYIYICLFLFFLIFKDYICIDYNFAILAITLFVIYLEIKNYEKYNNYFNSSFLFYFIIGLLCGSCILLKQTTGVFITIASLFYPILFVKNKIDFKNYLKITAFKIIGIIIPLVLLLIYLIANNALYDFFDYTILGIKTFSNKLPYSKLTSSKEIIIKLFSILIPIFILIFGIYLLIKKNKKLFGFYFYSIASLIVIFPISDNIHFLIGITPFIILLIYFSYNIINFIINNLKNRFNNVENTNNNQNINSINKSNNIFRKIYLFFIEFLRGIIFMVILIYFITSIIFIKDYIIDNNKNHNVKHYSLIPIPEQLLEKINILDNYIISEKNNVYILDAEASIYMISLDRYYKDFNFFLKGNIGSKGEDGLIEKIKNLNKGEKILIKNNKSSKNWQTPLTVINYIENNLTKINEINIFDVYEIK